MADGFGAGEILCCHLGAVLGGGFGQGRLEVFLTNRGVKTQDTQFLLTDLEGLGFWVLTWLQPCASRF